MKGITNKREKNRFIHGKFPVPFKENHPAIRPIFFEILYSFLTLNQTFTTMPITNQIFITGKTDYVTGNDPTGTITYDLAETMAGMAVTAEVFQEGVAAYIKAAEHSPTAEKVNYKFSKQLLLFLLSFETCTSLVFIKFIKPGGEDSLAVVAVDKDNKPLGWNTGTDEFNENMFVGSEWSQGISLADAKEFIDEEKDYGFNFGAFFETFS